MVHFPLLLCLLFRAFSHPMLSRRFIGPDPLDGFTCWIHLLDSLKRPSNSLCKYVGRIPLYSHMFLLGNRKELTN